MKYFVLVMVMILNLISCRETGVKKNFNVSKIYYSFNQDVENEIENVFKNRINKYGILIDICDFDKNSFSISLHNISKHPKRHFFLSTNKFYLLKDKTEIPIITSDVAFSREINPVINNDWKRIDGSGCIEKITFNFEKIVNKSICNDDI